MNDGRPASIDRTQFLIRGSPRSLLDLSENEMFNDLNTGWQVEQQISIPERKLAQAVPGIFQAGCHPAVRSLLAERPDKSDMSERAGWDRKR
jgi:hypothetical protein